METGAMDRIGKDIKIKDSSFGSGRYSHAQHGHARSKSASENKGISTAWDIPLAKDGKLKKDVLQDPCNQRFNDRKRLAKSQRRAALEQDVEQLQKRLQYERSMRNVLEKAMGRGSSAVSPGHRPFGPETTDLITEIAMLEEEVTNREQHVLSLYRNIFDQCVVGSLSTQSSVRASPAHTKSEDKTTPSRFLRSLYSSNKLSAERCCNTTGKQGLPVADSQASSRSMQSSLETAHEMMDERIQSLHSQTACKLQRGFDRISFDSQSSLMRSVLKGRISETPNRLSEELVRCMIDIYCKLSDPPAMHHGSSLSSSTAVSLTSVVSPYDNMIDGWSPRRKVQSMCDIGTKNPFDSKGEFRCIGPYSSMVEVPWICADKDHLAYATSMLQMFRSIVESLEKVDPSQMSRECKLAFWINIHNALVMHAYLAYGIPKSSLKRMPLFQRAAYKIGGYSISAMAIEHLILCCRTYRPVQWLETLLSTGARIKMGEEKRTLGAKYGLDEPEPLVYFALSGGGYSDPAVRIYTAKNVVEELDRAKREFLQATVSVHNQKKVYLPRLVERYAKAASINLGSLLQWVCQNVDAELGNAIQNCMERNSSRKSVAQGVEWLPYNGKFRYLFDRELIPEML